MKVCTYCDSICADDATVCKNCNGKDFRFRCENCGTEFEEGRFCPSCGVRVGQKAKTCPRCGQTYYSPACPSCGYLPTRNAAPAQTIAHETTVQPQKRRNVTLGSILLWIFFTPIMGIIELWRAPKLPIWAKLVLTTLIAGFTYLIAYA